MQTVEVSQRHRDAAADAMEAGYISASGIIAHVRAGRSDENAFVQAFARFEASLPPSAPDRDADKYRLMLLDLLAVIHRDGGHKTEEIGITLAHEQALQISSERIAALALPGIAEAVKERCAEVASKYIYALEERNGIAVLIRDEILALKMPDMPDRTIARAVQEACAAKADQNVAACLREAESLLPGQKKNTWLRAAEEIGMTASAIRSLDLSGIADAWQPIETAPKDGTTVDLWWEGIRFVDCFWMDANEAFPNRLVGWVCTKSPKEPFHLSEIRADPTHWRPLPAPPADLSNKGVG